MPTDIVAGTSGDVEATGFNGDIDGWAATIDVGTTSYRTFASAWMNNKNVSYSMNGQFTGTIQFDDSDTKPVPDDGGDIDESSFEGITLTLTAESGCTFTGTANISGVSLNRPAADRMTGTWNFQFDGQPESTWDEGGA